MAKLDLLPGTGSFYKANLHTHSTVSDGQLTPAQLKEMYVRHGYQILALTDHELLVDHSDLNDDNFLTLTSYEYAIIESVEGGYPVARTIEFNLFAKEPHNLTQVCFDYAAAATPYYKEYWRAKDVKYVGEPYKKQFGLKCAQEVIDAANANGFLISLNHPRYSMITPEFFGQLHGLFAMEVYNHISFMCEGVEDCNIHMYEEMLAKYPNLYCIAADDAHTWCDSDNAYCDKFGGFVMIKAPKLEYGAVINALEQGHFYASTGPEIFELYVEDGKVHLTCSPAQYVTMNGRYRNNRIAAAPVDGALTEVTFDVIPEEEYMRFTVFDHHGKRAYTHAYPVSAVI